jgi:hypothetical protein
VSSLDAFSADIQRKRSSQPAAGGSFLPDPGSTLDAFTAEILVDGEALHRGAAETQQDAQPSNAFGIHFADAAAMLRRSQQDGTCMTDTGDDGGGSRELQLRSQQSPGGAQEHALANESPLGAGPRSCLEAAPLHGSPGVAGHVEAERTVSLDPKQTADYSPLEQQPTLPIMGCSISPIPLRLAPNGGLADGGCSQHGCLFRSEASLDAFAAAAMLGEDTTIDEGAGSASNPRSQTPPPSQPCSQQSVTPVDDHGEAKASEAQADSLEDSRPAMSLGLQSLFAGGTSAEALDAFVHSLKY